MGGLSAQITEVCFIPSMRLNGKEKKQLTIIVSTMGIEQLRFFSGYLTIPVATRHSEKLENHDQLDVVLFRPVCRSVVDGNMADKLKKNTNKK